MNELSFFGIVGGVAAPALAAKFVGQLGWKKAVYVGGAAMVASMVLSWALKMVPGAPVSAPTVGG